MNAPRKVRLKASERRRIRRALPDIRCPFCRRKALVLMGGKTFCASCGTPYTKEIL